MPVNRTVTNQLQRDDLHNWPLLPVIRALTCMAALLHDWGKANARFQQKLDKDFKGSPSDRLRHEWVSCLLFKALILDTDHSDTDDGWLNKILHGEIDEPKILKALNGGLEKPLAELPPIAQLVSWLIVSHHKLPINFDNLYGGSSCKSLDGLLTLIDKNWGYENPQGGELITCLTFPGGLLTNSKKWLSQLKRWSGKLLACQDMITQANADGSYRVLLHHARLSLMLGDHYFSSLDITQTGHWHNDTGLIANTQKDKSPKQALDQHLIGVYESAKKMVGRLPAFENDLAPSFNTTALKRPSPQKFNWQNIAARKVRDWRQACGETKKGFFAVNMASTGCGKTFANAKVMMALSEEGDTLRYILALGLRTLTLQTGDEYRERIFNKSDGSDLAVMIGSKAIADLHYQQKQDTENGTANTGSESAQSLLDDSDDVIYDVELPVDGLTTVLQTTKDRKLLYAPVLACTIDHIIAATETTHGGRYILPALRLLSSDLVIDEVDDFTGSDLIAIGRLIHLAGMLGRKVMISSATIPPAMAEGYFNAYLEGWSLFCQTRHVSPLIGAAWIDEFTTKTGEFAVNPEQIAYCLADYRNAHDKFIELRTEKLSKQPAKRKAMIIDCHQAMQTESDGKKVSKRDIWFSQIAQATVESHQRHHTQEKRTGLNVSFGVIRIANIKPCVQLTQFLLDYEWPENIDVRVMAYHSRQVLLLRHEQEKHLDAILKRKEKPNEEPAAFSNNVIRQHLDDIREKQPAITDLLFILVATPVEEVGRDHDFDWAVIEPSSYRSIIQLAGRVRRHRDSEVEQPNISILQYNLRTIKQGDKPREPRFCWPGYESNGKLPKKNKDERIRYAAMKSHNLFEIVDIKRIAERLDAIPRIQERQKNSQTPMALLEHAVIDSQLTYYDGQSPDTLQGYLRWYWHLTALPQKLHSFRQSNKNNQLYRIVNHLGDSYFTERNSQGKFEYKNNGDLPNQDGAYKITTQPLIATQSERLWLRRDYLPLLQKHSEQFDMSLTQAAIRYGEINLDIYSDSDSKAYQYNDQLGLYEKESDDA
ncbi:MAG: type I-F CRISPR-associated helicase Cas3f [Gammaproteobacteria bacterium]|nr:type I-F CRISPR-associated helicase Cas3f [Gammaproteobacteria bacterium]